jgi:hypothetical protein
MLLLLVVLTASTGTRAQYALLEGVEADPAS